MATEPVEMSERLLKDSRKTPLKAIAEAIWNALDVGADHVKIDFEFTSIEAIQAVTVVDDGAGMNRERARVGFGEYGDSWKRRIDARTHNGRTVHGQRGQGRYDILRLGQTARWLSIAEQIGGALGVIEVELHATDPRNYKITDPSPHAGPTGTTLRISNVTLAADKELNRPDLADLLAADFALYLRQYPDVDIKVRGVSVDPSSIHMPPVDVKVEVEGLDQPVNVTFIEWKRKSKGMQRIYLCDANGAALLDVPADLRPRDILFTGYICWDGFKGHDTSAHLAILGGEDLGARVYAAGRKAISEQLAQRNLERQAQVVEDWKSEQSYPYKAEPTTAPEHVIRKAFDVVATAATPVLTKMNVEQRRFSMQIMRVAVETDPSAVQRVMREVLRLPEERVEEMAALFERTTLESIITTTHSVLNRLDFLVGLRSMVFDPESKKATAERRQLHKILEREAWLFGDEWTLTASDETLRRVLVKHLNLLGENVAYTDVMPESQEDGHLLIPDLVLSGSASSYSKSHEYLVVELKRPSVTLGKVELDQIEGYAIAITEDDQFSQPGVSWDFWLIGNDYDPYITRKLNTPGNPHGCALVSPKFRVHVRTWAEVLADAEHRHRYIQRALASTSDEEAGLAYLNRVHQHLLPNIMSRDTGPTDPAPPAQED
jgi:hypothetical protein